MGQGENRYQTSAFLWTGWIIIIPKIGSREYMKGSGPGMEQVLSQGEWWKELERYLEKRRVGRNIVYILKDSLRNKGAISRTF